MILSTLLLLAACSTVSAEKVPLPVTNSAEKADKNVQDSSGKGSPDPVPTNVRVDDQNEYHYSQLLPFDAIPPIYEPRFLPADRSPLNEDELVIGVQIDGKAKAYPITVLRIREMVNDELSNWPILVTW